MKLLFTIGIILLSAKAFTQTKIIIGLIKDGHSDEPISYSSAKFVVSKFGKQADSVGKFQFVLNASKIDTLEISSVGYASKKYVLIVTEKDTIFITALLVTFSIIK